MELIGLANYALFMGIFIGIYALLALGLNIVDCNGVPKLSGWDV